MLKIKREVVHVDDDTWFYVNRKSIHVVHWQSDGCVRRVTCDVPVSTLRNALAKLGVQAAKEKKRRIRRAMEARR